GGGRWIGPRPDEAPAGAGPSLGPTSSGSGVRRGRHAVAGRLSAERALLDRARGALARSDGDGALVPLARHASGFPRGQLVEEREGMWVKALVLAARPKRAPAPTASAAASRTACSARRWTRRCGWPAAPREVAWLRWCTPRPL